MLTLVLPQSATADEIRLRNGDRISGQLVDLSPVYCIFTTTHQATLYIERQEVLQLNTTQPVVVELNSSERIVGTIEDASEQGVIILQSERFGTLPVKLTDIMRITRVESAFVTGTAPKPVEKESLPPLPRPLDSSLTLPPVTKNNPPPPSKPPLLKTAHSTQPIQQTQTNQNAPPSPLINPEGEEETRQSVLRQSVVLLKAGEREIATGLTYDTDTTTEARHRLFKLPLILRLGLTDRLESALYLPIVGSEYTAHLEDYRDRAFGVGDMSLDFNYLFFEETYNSPDIYGTVSFGIPTGNKYKDMATTGNGHGHLFAGVTLAKSYDPAILFGGLGYTRTFKRKFSTGEIAPGDSWDYYFGLGLSINSQLALGLQFLGNYQQATKHDGKTVDSSYEPMYLKLSVPYDMTSNTYIEPALTFGLNQEARDVILDFYYGHKF